MKTVDNDDTTYDLKQRLKKMLHTDDITIKKRSRLLPVFSEFSLALHMSNQQCKLRKHGWFETQDWNIASWQNMLFQTIVILGKDEEYCCELLQIHPLKNPWNKGEYRSNIRVRFYYWSYCQMHGWLVCMIRSQKLPYNILHLL